MRTSRLVVGVAALVSVLGTRVAFGESDRTGQGPQAAPARNDPNAPNPVRSPGRDETSIPGRMEHPNAGMTGPKDESGATESGNARLPRRPDGDRVLSGPGSGAGIP
jgi:hypothetical protein